MAAENCNEQADKKAGEAAFDGFSAVWQLMAPEERAGDGGQGVSNSQEAHGDYGRFFRQDEYDDKIADLHGALPGETVRFVGLHFYGNGAYYPCLKCRNPQADYFKQQYGGHDGEGDPDHCRRLQEKVGRRGEHTAA